VFARTQPWLQAGKYVSALASELPRVNGWSIARRGGDRTPDRTQRLLNHASWDTFAAMSVVRRFAVAGLEAAARRGRRGGMVIGAIDETGQEKAGQATAGVKRHYLGCAGKVANGITTVHLAYVREKAGHALIAARQWIPREHVEDPAKQQIMGLPEDLVFRTKGQLAIDLLTEVFADGIWLDFVCGDEVYGGCTPLREYCEERGQGYVLRVPSNFHLTVARGVRLTCKQAATRLAARGRSWEIRSAGKGSKGARWYAWAWLATTSPGTTCSSAATSPPASWPFTTATCPTVSRCHCPGWSAPPGCAGRWKKASSSARASGWTSPRSASTPRSPGTPCW
jgi:SRSO17 transposase